MLDLPFELVHTLRHGCEAQGLASLADLPAMVWRMRGHAAVPAECPVFFPGDVDRPLLQALGLGPDGVAQLCGSWSPWGAPLLPEWLRTVCPPGSGGWTSDLVQILRTDYSLE
eukprot:4927496-Alexandrium_andersonii.AAC.1